MVIYGVALLAGCMMAGLVIGDLLGEMLNIDSNLGGVGIAMLLLIFITGVLKDRGKMADSTASGINFWNAMYIPIVVAMAASQNVVAAFSGGMVALVAGVLADAIGARNGLLVMGIVAMAVSLTLFLFVPAVRTLGVGGERQARQSAPGPDRSGEAAGAAKPGTRAGVD